MPGTSGSKKVAVVTGGVPIGSCCLVLAALAVCRQLLLCAKSVTLRPVAAANKGIGWDVARILAEQGLTTVVASRNEELGREATEKLRKATGASRLVCVTVLNAVPSQCL